MLDAAKKTEFPTPAGVFAQTVTQVQHYTDRLFRFRMTRPDTFRFRSGEFVMIGLPNAEKPVFRAYSVASPSWDGELEFYSIKVPDGPLTEHLQKIKEGDTILMRKKPTGTLVNDALLPGKRLWMFSTGTGFAPFASLVRDPETYEKFDEVIVTHTCRDVAELGYGRQVIEGLSADPLIGEFVNDKLIYYPTTTRERSPRIGRITTLLKDGTIFKELGIDGISPEADRAMVCGSMGLNMDMKAILEGFGLEGGANSDPKHYVVEKAFVG
ncbi:MAG: ferredoxin--NADP reductase [Pseudomonadota bacterium]